MIRVLLDCRMADWSGVGRYTAGLARALHASRKVTLVQVLRPGAEPPVPSAEVLHAEGNPFTFGGARRLASAIRASRPDVTHCPHFPTPLPAPHPLVVTLQDLSPLLVPGVMPSLLRRAVYRYWNGRAALVADRVIAPSTHTAADVARVFPLAADKLRVILDAADDFATGPVGELPPYASGGPYVLSMGNTKPHKDLPTLLRAFARLAPGRPALRLLLVGAEAPGFVAGVLGDDAAAARVSFTGPVADEQLRALYAHAAAFAFPSRYEGFGLPPLEAMAFGAPVVVSDAASLPEVVGDAALSFPAGDDAALAERVATALDDDAERERLSRAGRARAAELTWAETARRTIAVYREVLR